MNPKVKYWLEDNKDRLAIGFGVLAMLVIIVGGLTLLQKNNDYTVGEEVGVVLADYLVAQKEDGDLEIIDVNENQVVQHTITLKNDEIVFRGENLNEVFIYYDGTVHRLSIVDHENITLEAVVMIDGLEDVSNVITGSGYFGFQTPDGLVVADFEGNEVFTYESEDVAMYHLADNGLYIAKGTELHYIDYAEQDTQYIDIGDTITQISQHDDLIIVRNNFGSGEDIETLLYLSDGLLYIDELVRVTYGNKVDIPIPRNENYIAYIHQRVDKEGTVTRQDLETIVLESATEEETITDITIPLETAEPFSAEKTLAVQGYIYDWTDTGIRIVELRNGREVERINTTSDDVQFFVPIHTN